MDIGLYQKWLDSLFNHNEVDGDWRFDSDDQVPFLSDEKAVDFIITMLNNYNRDINGFSDWQISHAIEYIFNPSYSDCSISIRDSDLTISKRVEAIKSIKKLFHFCFEKRCVESDGENGSNLLNTTCLNLWDMTAITYCEESRNKNELYAAVADVMQYALSLNNSICVLSGLRGLRDLSGYYKPSKEMISQFIENYIDSGNPYISSLVEICKIRLSEE